MERVARSVRIAAAVAIAGLAVIWLPGAARADESASDTSSPPAAGGAKVGPPGTAVRRGDVGEPDRLILQIGGGPAFARGRMSDAEGALVGRVGMRFTERFGATLQLTHVIDEKNERSLQLVGPEVVVFASPRWSFDAGAGVAHFVEESQNRASDICTLIGCLPETVRERTERSGLFGTVGATSLLTTRSKRGRHRRALALSISMTGYSLPGDGLHALGRVALGYSF